MEYDPFLRCYRSLFIIFLSSYPFPSLPFWRSHALVLVGFCSPSQAYNNCLSSAFSLLSFQYSIEQHSNRLWHKYGEECRDRYVVECHCCAQYIYIVYTSREDSVVHITLHYSEKDTVISK